MTKLVLEISLFFRWGLFLALRFFNILPLLSGYGFRSFNKLTWENQASYLKEWAESQRAFKRDLFKAIKGIIALVTLSNKALWDDMQYYPKVHLENKIELRQKIQNEKRSAHNS